MRGTAGIVGLGVLGAAAHVTIVSGGGYGSAHAVLTLAVAAGVGVGAAIMGAVWAQGRRWLACALMVALLCGEIFGLAQTAERLIAQREVTQAPAREAERMRQALVSAINTLTAERDQLRPARLDAALAAQRTVMADAAEKSAQKLCAANCRLLLEEQLRAARADVAEAAKSFEKERAGMDGRIADERSKLEAWRAPQSGTMLADRLGWAPWALDLAMAALGSLGANGLAATLLAYAAHRRIVPPPALQVEEHQAGLHQPASEAASLVAAARAPAITSEARETVVVVETAGAGVVEPILRKKPIGDFVDFIAGSVELADGAVTAQSDLAGAYVAWCRRRKCDPLPDEMIGQGIEMFCRAGKVERGRRGSEIYLLGVGLTGARRKRIAAAG
jgi:hypothetical protein